MIKFELKKFKMKLDEKYRNLTENNSSYVTYYDVKIVDCDEKNALETLIAKFITNNIEDEKRMTPMNLSETRFMNIVDRAVFLLINLYLKEFKDKNSEEYVRWNNAVKSFHGFSLDDYTYREIEDLFHSIEKSWNKTKRSYLISKL